MADFSSFNELAKILNTLTPHIEERAVRYSMYTAIMAGRVRVANDMPGSWNERKVSEYLRPGRAKKLSESTVIPDSKIYRARLNSASPDEWGDSYPVSDRRVGTDLEPILSELIMTLGQSLSMRREKQIFKTLLAMSDSSNTYDKSSVVYDMSFQIAMQQEFNKKGLYGTGELFHVFHPFQELPVQQALIDLSKPANLRYREEKIASWNIGGFGNLNTASSPLLPRRMVYKLSMNGASGGTFKLRAGEYPDGTEAITGDITYSATHATLLSNILAALNALSPSLGTWTGASASVSDITITAPSAFYVDAEDELRVPVTSDDNGVKAYPGSALTGGSTVYPLIWERVGATAIAPMFFRDSVLLDIRTPFTLVTELRRKYRTIENYAHETYAVSDWRPDYVLFIKTKAESPFAVA